MKEGKPSHSAEVSAGIRALDSKRAESERVCSDSFAKAFLGKTWAWICWFPPARRSFIRYIERVYPGLINCLPLRTRYIDDYLSSCIRDGIDQLVILGAGYDSRAYRLEELQGKVKVFEVDQPATQRVKKAKVGRIFGSVPGHVVYVPVDFNKEKFGARLLESGYNAGLKTMFICESVTTYLTDEAVDEMLAFVVNNSGEGSSIIFDYMLKSVVDGSCKSAQAETVRKAFNTKGEYLIFGIDEGTIDEFLSERGFYNITNVTADFLGALYLKDSNRNRKLCSLCSIVHASVRPR